MHDAQCLLHIQTGGSVKSEAGLVGEGGRGGALPPCSCLPPWSAKTGCRGAGPGHVALAMHAPGGRVMPVHCAASPCPAHFPFKEMWKSHLICTYAFSRRWPGVQGGR